MQVEKTSVTGSSLLPTLGILVVTVGYLWFELRYNLALLDLFSHETINQAEVDNLSVRGKVLASVGLVWAIFRSTIARIPNWFSRIGIFVAATVVVYASLSGAYEYVIRNLSPETKVDGFHLAAYRQALIEKSIIDPDVPLPAATGIIGLVFMVSIPLVLFDERYTVPARSILALRAKLIEDYYWKKVDEGWIKYDRNMQSLGANYRQYLDGSRRVETAPSMFHARAIERFRRESGGMTPNSRASLDEFMVQLSRSSSPAAVQFRSVQEQVVFIDREGTPDAMPIKAADVPKSMNESEFKQYFAVKIDAAKNELLPTPDKVESAPRINDINSSVFIPPMAMITSLISIVANAASILWILVIRPITATIPVFRSAGSQFNQLFAPVFVLTAISLTFSMSSRFAFDETSQMRSLEQKMQARMGPAGAFWSHSAAFQIWLYNNTAFIRRI